MSKKNIRLLATGFLLSGLVLVILHTVPLNRSEAQESDNTEELQSEINYLEEKIASLELENDALTGEIDSLEVTDSNDSDESNETNEEDHNNDEDDESDEEDAEENSDEQESEEVEVETFTILVQEGEPSSVVASQLENFGLIDDRFSFNDYLEDNDLYLRVRAGEYEVDSTMDRQQLINAVIR